MKFYPRDKLRQFAEPGGLIKVVVLLIIFVALLLLAARG
jgi:hypothetical protein